MPRVTVDITSYLKPNTVIFPDLDPTTLVGQTVTVDGAGHGGKVVDAWIVQDARRAPRVVAEIEIPEWLHELLQQPADSISLADPRTS